MKKVTLAVAVASILTSSVFAEDYGFRDYLANNDINFLSANDKTTILLTRGIKEVGTYCAIEGGNINGILTTRLGTSNINLYTDEEANKLQSMSKSDRIAKYGNSFDTNFNKEFTDKLKTYDMGNRFECKLPSGEVVFSALNRTHAWIVEHGKEKIEDRVFYAVYTGNKDANFMGYTTRKGRSTEIKKTLNSEYPTYNSFFDDWQNGFMDRAKKTKQGDNYEFGKTFMFGYDPNLGSMMNELQETQYFCESKNGEFLKDGKSFREYLKDFYLKNTSVGQDTFRGIYVCQNTPEAFTLSLDGYYPKRGDNFNFYMDDAIIKKGANSITNASTTRNTVAKKGMDGFDVGFIKQVIAEKTTMASTIGITMRTGVYEGRDANGCDLAYMERHIVTIPTNSSEIFKYKQCNGDLSLRN
jgi:hypothetical protein